MISMAIVQFSPRFTSCFQISDPTDILYVDVKLQPFVSEFRGFSIATE